MLAYASIRNPTELLRKVWPILLAATFFLSLFLGWTQWVRKAFGDSGDDARMAPSLVNSSAARIVAEEAHL